MCYNVQVCIVKQPGSEQLGDSHSNEAIHANAKQQLLHFSTLERVSELVCIVPHSPLPSLTVHEEFLLFVVFFFPSS